MRRSLIDATARLLFERGADPTLDDIAEESGVGRRTIFRYFASKDDLVAAALSTFFRELAAEVPTRDDREVHEWLLEAARVIHTQNTRIAPSYLELAPRRRQIAGVTEFLDCPGRPHRRDRMTALAQEAWTGLGNTGKVPDLIVDSFTLHLSVYGTEALRFHARLDVDAMAELTVATLTALLVAAQVESSSSPKISAARRRERAK